MPRRLQPVPGGFGRGPRIADLMTAEYHSLCERSWKAERAGDAAAALAFHRRIPMFRRSAHTVILNQLVELADQMTPWLWVRWAAYQCTRAEDRGTASGDINRASLQYVVQMFHGREMQRRYDAHEDPVPFIASTAGEDWAFHQICTFEMGGLEKFVEDLATAPLAEEAALAHRWRDCPVSGYTVACAADERAAYLGAAALNPRGYAAARRSLGPPAGTWERWARLVAEPARTRLRLLAEAGTTAA